MQIVFANENNHRTSRFIALSLILHVLLFAFLNSPAPKFFNSEKKEEEKFVTVEILPMPKAEEYKNQQIVETDLSEKSKDVAKDSFLGAQNQIVDRQTKSNNIAAFKSGRVGGKPGSSQVQEVSPKIKDISLGSLGLVRNYKPLGHINPGELGASNDHLTEVKEGAQTLLNTREFAYFSFYQRVRRQLEQFWEPGLRDRIDKMITRGRSIATEHEHSTRLLVMLDGSGTIRKILVEGTSGYNDLDQAAVEAFNKAGPFPNPPKGIIDVDGFVRVAWEFVLRT